MGIVLAMLKRFTLDVLSFEVTSQLILNTGEPFENHPRFRSHQQEKLFNCIKQSLRSDPL